eukprot:15197384-Alexandrium_andersonii.AAC.1
MGTCRIRARAWPAYSVCSITAASGPWQSSASVADSGPQRSRSPPRSRPGAPPRPSLRRPAF